MKKIFLFSFFISIIFTSCDFVGNPYPEVNANLGDTATCPSLSFPTVTTHIKKILIEDYTGHTCGNCPRAADTLASIDALYPGQIVGLAVHVGSFATPSPGYAGSPATAFLADYRTSVGDQYDATFGASAFGLPAGMFNRKDFAISDHIKFYTGWKAYAASIASEPSVVDLQIAVDFDLATRKICCAVKDSFLTTISDTLKMVVLLTQDSIIDWQDNVGVITSTYVHRHMLRDAITPGGAWGESLISGSIPVGTTHIKKFAYTIPADYKGIPCDVEQCHIIAFIYRTSNYEIIQVEEVELIP